jgi:putative ATPase
LDQQALRLIISRALENDNILSKLNITITDWDLLIHYGGGDARRTLNVLESCIVQLKDNNKNIRITGDIISRTAQHNALLYDKQGDYHYDLISAYIPCSSQDA